MFNHFHVCFTYRRPFLLCWGGESVYIGFALGATATNPHYRAFDPPTGNLDGTATKSYAGMAGRLFLGYEEKLTGSFTWGAEIEGSLQNSEMQSDSRKLNLKNSLGVKIKGGWKPTERTTLYLHVGGVASKFEDLNYDLRHTYLWGVAPGVGFKYDIKDKWSLHADAEWVFYEKSGKFDHTSAGALEETSVFHPRQLGLYVGLSYKL